MQGFWYNDCMADKISQLIEQIYHAVQGIWELLNGEMRKGFTETREGVGVLREDIKGLKIGQAGMREDIKGLKTDQAGMREDVAQLDKKVTTISLLGNAQHKVAEPSASRPQKNPRSR